MSLIRVGPSLCAENAFELDAAVDCSTAMLATSVAARPLSQLNALVFLLVTLDANWLFDRKNPLAAASSSSYCRLLTNTFELPWACSAA